MSSQHAFVFPPIQNHCRWPPELRPSSTTPPQSPETSISSPLLLQVVAVHCLERHAVERLELLHLLQSLLRKPRFTLKGMQNDSLQQIAQRHIFLFGDRLEYFQHAFFHADAGLHPLPFHHFAFFPFV